MSHNREHHQLGGTSQSTTEQTPLSKSVHFKINYSTNDDPRNDQLTANPSFNKEISEQRSSSVSTPVRPEELESLYPTGNLGMSYATKKNIAQGLIDAALFSANVGQLHNAMRSCNHNNDFLYKIVIALISTSLILQVMAGFVLFFIFRYDSKSPSEERNEIKDHLSDAASLLVFMIMIINMFIATFETDIIHVSP